VGRGISVAQAGPIDAAIQTVSRTVDYRVVPYTGEPAAIQDINVGPQEQPIRINFQSKSSPVVVTQQHIGAEPGQVQVTQSEDEPQVAIHNVNRAVRQEVNEVVQPYRTLNQIVEPVIESTHTNIARGEGVRLSGLTLGFVGGSGVIGASGIGIAAAPAVGVAGLGIGGYRTGAIAAPAVGVAGLGAYRTGGIVGLGGVRSVGIGYGGGLGYGTGLAVGGVRSAGLGYGYGNGLGLGGVYGTRVASYGVGVPAIGGSYGSYGVGGYGLGSGIGLSGLSGLSTYGTTSRIARY